MGKQHPGQRHDITNTQEMPLVPLFSHYTTYLLISNNIQISFMCFLTFHKWNHVFILLYLVSFADHYVCDMHVLHFYNHIVGISKL